MNQHILIALEGKPTDEAAIVYVEALSQEISAKVTFLRVITVTADGSGGLGRQFQTEPGSNGWRKKNRAKETLANLEKRFHRDELSVDTALVIGDRSEADEIVAFASNQAVDLIVMAADGRPWWQRVLFGCPADGVHRKSTAPTLFVSDGTRRAKVVMREKVLFNPTMAALGSSSI